MSKDLQEQLEEMFRLRGVTNYGVALHDILTLIQAREKAARVDGHEIDMVMSFKSWVNENSIDMTDPNYYDKAHEEYEEYLAQLQENKPIIGGE